MFTPACRGCGGVPLFFIKPPARRKTAVSAEICRTWFIGVSLFILIALKPSVEYLLLTVDFFSAVPHTLQLTLCSHSMRGVLALTFLAPSDAVDGRIMFTMSQVHVQSPPHSPLPSLPLDYHKSHIHTMGIAFDKSQATCVQLLGRDLYTKCDIGAETGAVNLPKSRLPMMIAQRA